MKRASVALLCVAAALTVFTGCRSAISYYKDGLEQMKAKQYDEAVKSFSSAIERDPESDIAYLNRGDAFAQLNQHDKAVLDYNQAIAIKAGNPWYYNRRGLAFYKLQRYQEALDDWKKAKDLEERRAAQGFVVRKADAFYEMQTQREDLLPQAEKQAAQMPEPGTGPGPGTGEPTPPTGPAVAGGPGTGETPATGTGETPATGTGETPATGTGETPATGTGESPATGSGGPPATGSGEAPAAAEIRPATRLSGTWRRTSDDLVFKLTDDGRRIIGELITPDQFGFQYFEVTLAWKADRWVEGYSVQKIHPDVSPCQFEYATEWKVEVKDDGTLQATIEDPVFDTETCTETRRVIGEYTFAPAK